MDNIKIRVLGVGAFEFNIGGKRLFVDAFNSINPAEELTQGDIVICTHDDADHFSVSKFPDMRDLDIIIIGPPSIIKQLIENDKATIDHIKVIYSQNNKQPSFIEIDGLRIISFGTPHFLDWKPIHNSYLIEFNHCKIYITGDSYLTKDLKEIIGQVDVIICNLVDEGFITGKENPNYAIHHHMSYLLNMISDYKPQKIIGLHLINFDGTVNAYNMKKLIDDYQFNDIIIPTEVNEIISI